MADLKRPPTNYWDYIRVPDLLELQGGLEGKEADLSQEEVVFIAVHQVYELWLKLILRDLVAARNFFAQSRVPDDALAGASRVLGRIRTILELATDHFRLIETLTPRDYLEFRDKLFPANGGQSSQFREIEILMGLEESGRIPYVSGGSYLDVLKGADGSESWAHSRVKARLQDKPTLREALDEWLFRTPINGSSPGGKEDEETVEAFLSSYLRSREVILRELMQQVCNLADTPEERTHLEQRYLSEIEMGAKFLHAEEMSDAGNRSRRRRIRAALLFIETYRELPLLAWPREVLDGIVAVEQAFVTFRQRHARMAERIIGRRIGTGGSSGVEYLDRSALKYRVFSDLWAVRTLLVRRDRSPDPLNPEFYRFQFEM